MSDLVDFLTARLDGLEQEARGGTLHARGCASWRRLWETGPNVTPRGCDCLVVNWLLLDIQSKREIIQWCAEVIGDRDLSTYGQFGALKNDPDALAVTLAVETLRRLAVPFGWHTDYRPEWRVLDG